MPISPSFVEHAVDLLSALGPVQARRLFGGVGLYCDGLMFGLLDDDELFLKTDGETRPWFLEAGCQMWIYPGMYETSYYRPPDEAHEDAEAMLPWARLALDAAVRAQAARAAKARAPRRAGAKAGGARGAAAKAAKAKARAGTGARPGRKGARPSKPRPARKAAPSAAARRSRAPSPKARRAGVRPGGRGSARGRGAPSARRPR
ncbi:TfoX domain protein [Anaeromyxobacter sp. K]|uniref:TfoX/Sxy family protein n=1 Tax=Anaeromyxobacter sp. (strain K) TaxID=447217 RepID=UPI00015F9D79|nr:TfoX/Sxy family protein [Anaeromyxobacter sp. K]ACG71493.1 TfoX domain protein [Anaeromyxobacter sp. K]